jgi:site-specific recombinase XerD
MSRKPTDFAYCLHAYFNDYLNKTYRASQNTVSAYSYTFTLLLQILRSEKHISPQKASIEALRRDTVLGFLDWLEEKRGNGISTRNQRLGALHSFCRFVQIDYPQYLLNMQDVLNIPMKKSPKAELNYLSHDGIKQLFEQPDLSAKQGRRDLMLLTLLYDTGARVSEMTNVKIGDLFLQSPASLRLLGKGRKFRQVPLMPHTVNALRQYLNENRKYVIDESSQYLFVNPSGQKLTRGGVAYILQNIAPWRTQLTPILFLKPFLRIVYVIQKQCICCNPA